MSELNAEFADIFSSTKGISLRLMRVKAALEVHRLPGDSRVKRFVESVSRKMRCVASMMDGVKEGHENAGNLVKGIRGELRACVDTLYRLEALIGHAESPVVTERVAKAPNLQTDRRLGLRPEWLIAIGAAAGLLIAASLRNRAV